MIGKIVRALSKVMRGREESQILKSPLDKPLQKLLTSRRAFTSTTPTFPSPTEEKIVFYRSKVLSLEEERKAGGFKKGWLYHHQCKNSSDLYAALRSLHKQGELELALPLLPMQKTLTSALTSPRLTIELVPRSCWYSNVRSEVSKVEWKMLQQIIFSAAKHQCEICGGQGLKWPVECHEIWHYDDTEHIQTLKRLIALCPSCHEVKHMGLAQIKGKEKKATEHLASINGWSAKEAYTYVREQFTVWEERSRYRWRLDLSWLHQHGIDVPLDPVARSQLF